LQSKLDEAETLIQQDLVKARQVALQVKTQEEKHKVRARIRDLVLFQFTNNLAKKIQVVKE